MGPVLKQYISEGKINFVYKHSAFLGQESVWAAQASECAADQGKFWEYHDLLFDKQDGRECRHVYQRELDQVRAGN